MFSEMMLPITVATAVPAAAAQYPQILVPMSVSSAFSNAEYASATVLKTRRFLAFRIARHTFTIKGNVIGMISIRER